MSAFLVDHDHIDALLTYAIEHGTTFAMADGQELRISRCLATPLGQILLLANVLGVRALYPHRDIPDRSAGYVFQPVAEPISDAQAAKACECLDYQCCEHRSWEGSMAHRIVKAIWPAGVTDACPVWQSAQWGFVRTGVAA